MRNNFAVHRFAHRRPQENHEHQREPFGTRQHRTRLQLHIFQFQRPPTVGVAAKALGLSRKRRQRHSRHDLRRICVRSSPPRAQRAVHQRQLGFGLGNYYRRQIVHRQIGLCRRIRPHPGFRQRGAVPLRQKRLLGNRSIGQSILSQAGATPAKRRDIVPARL